MADPQTVRTITERLIGEHLAGRGWTFAFDNAVLRAGSCDARRQRITLSKHLTPSMTEADVAQVALHEIAHALAGHAAAHGALWKATARRIGYTGERTYEGEVPRDRANWVGVCPAGHEHVRFRRPARAMSCGLCAKRFTRSALITWRRREAAARAAPIR